MSWKARHKVTRSHKVVESRARYIGISCIHLRTAHLYDPRICGSDGAMERAIKFIAHAMHLDLIFDDRCARRERENRATCMRTAGHALVLLRHDGTFHIHY